MLGSGFRIGRLYGINIRIDWSWLLIAGLITWNLTNIFGQLHPEWSPGIRLGLAMLAALLFFASVLTHEMAHSVVAKAQGLPVRNITLFLFGGVANIQREPPSPKAEFLIAIAGPAISLVIGAIMFALGLGSAAINNGFASPGRMIASLSPASTVLLWLGSINLILAVFNLIPGFPLDGGRVLRSILWAITRNLRTATRIASLIGQAIAWIMMAAGVMMIFGIRIPFFGTGLINGIWLGFIGWFLNNASMQSYQQVAIQDLLSDVPVERIMHRDPPTARPGDTVDNLVNTRILGADDQAFPVLEDGRLIGLVTLEDVRRLPRDSWSRVTVRDAMTPGSRLATVTPEEDAAGAMEILIQRDVLQVPVIGGNSEFLGLLRRRDIARWLQLNTGRGRKGRMQA